MKSINYRKPYYTSSPALSYVSNQVRIGLDVAMEFHRWQDLDDKIRSSYSTLVSQVFLIRSSHSISACMCYAPYF